MGSPGGRTVGSSASGQAARGRKELGSLPHHALQQVPDSHDVVDCRRALPCDDETAVHIAVALGSDHAVLLPVVDAALAEFARGDELAEASESGVAQSSQRAVE